MFLRRFSLYLHIFLRFTASSSFNFQVISHFLQEMLTDRKETEISPYRNEDNFGSAEEMMHNNCLPKFCSYSPCSSTSMMYQFHFRDTCADIRSSS